MHAASHSQTRRRSQTRTCVAQAASCVCSLCRITYPSGHKALSSRVRVTAFERPGNSASFQYDSNTNRLSALQKTIADSDLDGDYEAGAEEGGVRSKLLSAQLQKT